MNQFARCYLLTGLCLLIQLGVSKTSLLEKQEKILELQNFMETLIEKILYEVQGFYNDLHCIPDYVPANITHIIKKTINCVEEVEKNLREDYITSSVNKEMVQKCFSFGENQVFDLMKNVNPNEKYCPNKMAERNLQINVTTSFTKLFNIHITKGVVVTEEVVSVVNNN